MRPVGAGGLIWLMATACGETTSDSDSATPSNGSGGAASSGGSSGHGTAMGTVNTSSPGTGGTSTDGCPDLEPAPGTSCDHEALSCTFANCVAPEFRDGRLLTCIRGAWAVAEELECFPGCPGTAPDVGSSCIAATTPGPCPVENACGADNGYCVEGEWVLQDPAGTGGTGLVAPSCPEVIPTYGAECCPETQRVCNYSSGEGVPVPPPDGAQGGAGSIGTTGTTGGTGGTGDSGSSGSEDARPGVQGAVGSTGSMEGTGGTGGTGATGGGGPPCYECDLETRQWRSSRTCN